MVYFLVLWSLLGGICWTVGAALLNRLHGEAMERPGDRLIVALWLGLLTLATLLLALALIRPISPLVGWGCMGGMAILCSLWPLVRQEWRMVKAIATPRWLAVAGAIALVIALFTTRQVTWIDTGLYHYQLIKWLREAGVVPGLALLSAPLGYLSSWFALSAPLNPAWLEGHVSAGLNGFVLLLAVGQGVIALAQSVSGQTRLSDWVLIVFSLLTLPVLCFTNLLSSVLVSASPDIPIILLIGLVAWAMLAIAPTDSRLVVNGRLIPVILAAGAIGIKLIALPLLPVAVGFYLLPQRMRLKSCLTLGAIAGLFLLPVLAANIVATGCPLYPSALFCWNLPWSKTVTEVQDMAAATRGWGVWFGSPPEGVNPYLWMFWQWFHSIGTSKIIVALVGLSALAAFYVLWKGRRVALWSESVDASGASPPPAASISPATGIGWVAVQAIAGILFILSQAPLFRFGLGYVVLLPALAIALIMQSQQKAIRSFTYTLWRYWPRLPFNRVVGLVAASMVGVMLISTPVRDRLLIPPRFSSVDVESRQVNDVTFFFPVNEKAACWAAPLPCADDPTDEIYWRNPEQGVRGGFIRQGESTEPHYP